jgi:pyrimidine-specific ribonucleoside hydrolase
MKRKAFRIVGIVFGVLVLLFILLVPAAPLWVRLGVKPVCIQGEWPHMKFVPCPPTAANVTPLPTLLREDPIPIIVDDDGSPDGTIALLYFLNNPLFDVQAVTISCGEAHPDIFADHILQLLAELGRPDIPVGAGRATPLEGTNAFPDSWRQVSDAFWDIKLPQTTVSLKPVPAAELIVAIINNSPQPVRIFVSGTHTNLAEALRLDPEIKKNILDVYIMGGSIYVPGNIKSDWPSIDNSVAEWNIWVDPIAAREVFTSGLTIHVSPLDATNQVAWTQADAFDWADTGTPEGDKAAQILQWMLRSWSPDGIFIWDLVAAVNATDSRLCPAVPLSLDILTAPGPEQGRIVITDQTPNVTVCLEPEADLMRALATDMFGR